MSNHRLNEPIFNEPHLVGPGPEDYCVPRHSRNTGLFKTVVIRTTCCLSHQLKESSKLIHPGPRLSSFSLGPAAQGNHSPNLPMPTKLIQGSKAICILGAKKQGAPGLEWAGEPSQGTVTRAKLGTHEKKTRASARSPRRAQLDVPQNSAHPRDKA